MNSRRLTGFPRAEKVGDQKPSTIFDQAPGCTHLSKAMSALPPKADIAGRYLDVR